MHLKSLKAMNRCNLNYTLISFHLLLFTFFICNLRASFAQLIPNPLLDVCPLINCGYGTCKASNDSILPGLELPFDCECKPGWKKMQIGNFTFPPCVVPNCTLDFQCGNGSPVPPPSPAPLIPLPINLTSPCGLVWCGDGTCIINGTGTGHTCDCNEGSKNLMNLTGLPCFKLCTFGGDCKGLGFGQQTTAAPPPSNSGSTGNGSNDVPNGSRNLHALSIILLGAMFLTWV